MFCPLPQGLTMRNKFLALALCPFFFYCSESEKPVSSTAKVGSIYELGECTDERDGEEAFVVDEDHALKCLNGKWVRISDNKDEEADSFTDPRDGHVYRTVKLGTRRWMAENLNYAYNDGVQSFCYLDREEYCDYIGRLYTWSGAMAMDTKYDSTYNVKLDLPHQGVCPEGWHVSTMEDWEDLIDYVDANNGNESVAWNLMSNEGWYFNARSTRPNDIFMKTFDFKESNRNLYGFNLMSGVRFYDGTYDGIGDSSLTWVATNDALIEHIYAASGWPYIGYSSCYRYDDAPYDACYDENNNPKEPKNILSLVYKKGMGKPVRCVSDDYEGSPVKKITPKASAMGKSAYNDSTNTLLDKRDGKVYKTTKIGKQIWMAENLNFKTTGGNADDLEGSICPDNNEEYCDSNGRLYNWNAAMDIPQEYESIRWLNIDYPRQGICPGGWHLPTEKEWQELIRFIKDDIGIEDEQALLTSLCEKPEYDDESYYEEYPVTPDKYGFSLNACNDSHIQSSGYIYDKYGRFSSSRETLLWTATDANAVYFKTEITHVKPRHAKTDFGQVRCLKD